MANWLLAIDESGSLAHADDRALIGGVLMNARDTRGVRQALRARIEAALPGVPWPPHATELRSPSSRIVYAARSALGASPAAREAAARFGVSSNTACRLEAFKPLDIRLAQHPALLCALRMEARDGLERMRALTADLAPAALAPGRAWAVAAWEDTPAPDVGLARYRRLIDALADRVELLLSQIPGAGSPAHTVQVLAARYRDGGAESTAADLGRLATRPGAVRWVAIAPQAYHRDDCHPLLVIADFVCNRLRGELARDHSWSEVASDVRAQVGLSPGGPCRGASGPLPSVSALGPPAEALRRWSAGEPSDALLPPLFGHHPRWAGHQAILWISDLEGT